MRILVGYIALVLFVVVFGPLATIWALNTLFGLSIAYGFKTWLASALLSSLVGSSAVSKKK